MFRKGVNKGTVSKIIRLTSILGHLLDNFHCIINQPYVAQVTDHCVECHFVWGAILPNHLSNKLSSILPTLTSAQTLYRSVVTKDVWLARHAVE